MKQTASKAASKTEAKARRRAAQKPDTSAMIRTDAEGFTVNEWLESRLALRDRDPAAYLKQTSPALRFTVERYAELKGRAEG